MIPTLLNINAVNCRQCSLARSANGGFGKLCRLLNDRRSMCFIFMSYRRFTVFSNKTDSFFAFQFEIPSSLMVLCDFIQMNQQKQNTFTSYIIPILTASVTTRLFYDCDVLPQHFALRRPFSLTLSLSFYVDYKRSLNKVNTNILPKWLTFLHSFNRFLISSIWNN